jgi:hypothetical protein
VHHAPSMSRRRSPWCAPRSLLRLAAALAALALPACSTAPPREGELAQAVTMWTSIGGLIQGAPDACAWGPGRLDVFARGMNEHVWHQGYDNNAFSGQWEDLGSPSGDPLSDPTCAAWGPGHLDLFVVAKDGLLWSRTYDGGRWGGWLSHPTPNGAVLSRAGVDAASAAAGYLDVVAIGAAAGATDLFWLRVRPGIPEAWSALPRPTSGAAPASGAPGIAADLTAPYARYENDRPNDHLPHLTIFASDATAHLTTTETIYEGGSYDSWRDLGHRTAGGVDAAAFADGSVHTAVRADDGTVAVRIKTSSCGRWYSADGAATSDPSIVAFSPSPQAPAQDALFIRDQAGGVSYTFVTPPPPVTTDCDVRPILSFPSVAWITQTNTSAFAGAAPKSPLACDPSGANRPFLAELVNDLPFGSAGVLQEWAPRTPAPDPNRPTVNAADIYLSGDVAQHTMAGSDVRFDHPFGLGFVEADQTQAWPDDELEVRLDPAFRQFQTPVPQPLATANHDGPGMIHTELAKGQIAPPLRISSLRNYSYQSPGGPDVPDFAGARVVAKGQWIHDCGHPPYPSELHPPSFMAFAAPIDPRTTHSIAFANPYRLSQLYNPGNKALATAFDDPTRFTAAGTRSFSEIALDVAKGLAAEELFKSFDCVAAIATCTLLGPICLADPGFWTQVLSCKAWQAIPILDRDVGGGLVEATHLDQPLVWQVCAPQPRPPGMVLDVTYHFTARTGISVFEGAVDPAAGCVNFAAIETNDYTPMRPARSDFGWTVAQILGDRGVEESASLDALLAVFGASMTQLKIDAYPPLSTGAHLLRDAPIGVDLAADDQPYPFFGAATVAWKPQSPCASGVTVEPFTQGMAGCPGRVAWGPGGATARTLCDAASAHLCSAAEWQQKRGTITLDRVYDNYPTHDYWTSDNLGYLGAGTGNCSASLAGASCGVDRPMRVCAVNGVGTPTNPDPEGNTCTWANCGLAGATSPNNYLGGCVANPTAGALCCANP